MLSALVGRTETLHAALAEETCLIEVALCGVVGRCNEVDESALSVDAHFVDEVEVACCHWLYLLTVAAYAVEVTPSVAFAHPCKELAVLEPVDVVVGVEPCGIGVSEDVDRFGFANLDSPHAVGILLTVHLLDEEFVALRDEIHAWDVVVARISRDVYPCRRSAVGTDITHLDGGVCRSCLRVRETLYGRIERIDVVDDVEPSGAFGIALPVGNVLAVGTPSESVAAVELLLIHPVERTVDDEVATVGSELHHLAISYVLNIDVVLADVCHTGSVGRELGEHHCGFRTLAAQLMQSAIDCVEHPVVATGVVSPHTACVGVDEHLAVVGREGETAHRYLLACSRVDKAVGTDYHLTLVVLGSVCHYLVLALCVALCLRVAFAVNPVDIAATLSADESAVDSFLQGWYVRFLTCCTCSIQGDKHRQCCSEYVVHAIVVLAFRFRLV